MKLSVLLESSLSRALTLASSLLLENWSKMIATSHIHIKRSFVLNSLHHLNFEKV